MITSGAVSAPLLPHHRRVIPQITATHDFAGALGVYPSKRVLLVKLDRGARDRPTDVGEKSAKPLTLVGGGQCQMTCDQR